MANTLTVESLTVTGTTTIAASTQAATVIDGVSDTIQLRVQSNGTQTSNVFVIEQSDGTDILSVSNSVATIGLAAAGATDTHTIYGHVKIGTSATATGISSTSVRTIGNKKGSILFADSGTSAGNLYAGLYYDGTNYKYSETNKTGVAIEGSSAASGSNVLTVSVGSSTAAAADSNASLTTAITVGSGGATSLRGSATNDSASAGFVGEYVSSTVAAGSAVALTTATAKTITSISLTAGDWDIYGHVAFAAEAGLTVQMSMVAVGTTTDSLTGTTRGLSQVAIPLGQSSITDLDLTVQFRVSLSSTTTYYLIAYQEFSVGAPDAFGHIFARRVR